MLIRIRKIIKIKNYVRTESTIALLEEKFLNTTEKVFHTQIMMPRPIWTPCCQGGILHPQYKSNSDIPVPASLPAPSSP